MTKRIPEVGDVYKCLDGSCRVARTGELVRITYVNTGYTTADYTTIKSGCEGGWSFAGWPNDFEFVSSEQTKFEGKHYINVKAYAEKYGITLAKAHEEIQPKLFEMGYSWWKNSKEVFYAKASPSHYIDLNYCNDKEITHSTVRSHIHDTMTEILIEREETINLNFSVKEAPIEYVEFNGKQYEKAKLEQALKLIEGDE